MDFDTEVNYVHVYVFLKYVHVIMCSTDEKFNADTIYGDGNEVQFIQSIQQHTVAEPLIML